MNTRYSVGVIPMCGQRFSFQVTGGHCDGDLDSSVLKLSGSVRLSSSYAKLLSVIPLTPCSAVERLKIHAGSADRSESLR